MQVQRLALHAAALRTMPPPAGTAKPFDHTPHLPPAGLAGEGSDSAERCLKQDIYNPEPPCPEQIVKWRKNVTPGDICLHPGLADDADHLRVNVYGKAEPVGVKVHEVLNTAPKSYLMETAKEKKEAIYLSHKREPLGSCFVRGHKLPQPMATGVQFFGQPTPQDVTGDQSKHLLHPDERVIPEAERMLYVKSHSNYDPGEQRHRGYSWVDKQGAIDPTTFRCVRHAPASRGRAAAKSYAAHPMLVTPPAGLAATSRRARSWVWPRRSIRRSMRLTSGRPWWSRSFWRTSRWRARRRACAGRWPGWMVG